MPFLHDCIFGLAVGDAIGVPVEFQTREELKKAPVTDIRGYGTYHQPPGTWSDDSSLTFLLMDSLSRGFSLEDIAANLVSYKTQAAWTPFNEVFDIGITTSRALDRLATILRQARYEELPLLPYGADEYTNGNGALMRILPLYWYIKDKPRQEQFELIWQVGALTHGHIRSAMACFFYLTFLGFVELGHDIFSAYHSTITSFQDFTRQRGIAAEELKHFDRILSGQLDQIPAAEISSSGYVMHSLEASIWCLLRNDSYQNTILAAVNLGNDTDTTAAIVGGLAGGLYGIKAIPSHWLQALAKKREIEALCDTFQHAIIK